jgi:hypothetical protein
MRRTASARTLQRQSAVLTVASPKMTGALQRIVNVRHVREAPAR